MLRACFFLRMENFAHFNISLRLTPVGRWLLIRFNSKKLNWSKDRSSGTPGVLADKSMIQRSNFSRMCCYFPVGALPWILALTLVSAVSAQEARTRTPRTAGQAVTNGVPENGRQALAEGRQAFDTRCAGCHGLDGRGGERAPDIATRSAVQQKSDANLTRIIRNGIPGAGMPGFGSLDDGTAKSAVAYLRRFQGKSEAARL